MATQITADLPTLDFPREADYPTQEDWAAFSAATELNFGILGNGWSTQMQLWKTEANAMSTEFNTNATIAQGLANYQGDWISQGYALGQTVSVSGIYYICKLTHATGQNPTTGGSIYWNLAIGNWNLKVNNYGNETIDGQKNFTISPIVPTPAVTGDIITMDNIIQKTPVAIGYGTGAGGTVTQLTSKSTNVTLNKPTGKIITSNSALAANASVGFYLNNSLIEANDTIIVTIAAGDLTGNSYGISISSLNPGIVLMYITNKTGASRSESLTIKFDLIKGANS